MNPAQITPSDAAHGKLQRIPSMTELLKTPQVAGWLKGSPLPLVTECLRRSVEHSRKELLAGTTAASEPIDLQERILQQAEMLLRQEVTPRVRRAINATGILLHTGLGRAVLSSEVVDSMVPELKGCCTLAVDPVSGERVERDELIEDLLRELTGAEAATVVNNNAAATLLVLAGIAAGKEVIVSRGQLIEIGGSFRLPEVMAQSGAKLVEVGATNRTHLKDYRNAITAETAALLRVHPSNYRIVGFTSEVPLAELSNLARGKGLAMIDDLGAGALIDLSAYGLPHEPTVRESIEQGADLVLFSGDKLIGGSQAGIIVGRKDLIQRLRKHPLMRSLRVDKTCLMILERTLRLFRDPALLQRQNPTYRMLSTPLETLQARAEELLKLIKQAWEGFALEVKKGEAFLGSGSMPTQAIPSVVLAASLPGMSPDALARRLRTDEACVFARIEKDKVHLDLRTIDQDQLQAVADAFGRIGRSVLPS